MSVRGQRGSSMPLQYQTVKVLSLNIHNGQSFCPCFCCWILHHKGLIMWELPLYLCKVLNQNQSSALYDTVKCNTSSDLFTYTSAFSFLSFPFQK